MDPLVVCSRCQKINRVPLGRAMKPVCGNCRSDLPYHDGVQEVSAEGLAKLVRTSAVPVVADFWAPWCGPCRAFAPVFQDVARENGGRILFVKVNTEEHPQAAQAHGIRGIPTLIAFKGGAEINRQSGAMPAPMFREYLKRLPA